jgi:hypothetical protein
MADFTIPINARQTVRPTGTQVTQSTWNPEDGYSRQQEIEQARAKVLEEHKKYLEDATTTGQRLIALENKVAQLSNDITKLLQLLGQKGD